MELRVLVLTASQVFVACTWVKHALLSDVQTIQCDEKKTTTNNYHNMYSALCRHCVLTIK